MAEGRARPTDADRIVQVKNLRGVSGGHVGHGRSAARKGPIAQSCEKHTATALLSDSGAPGATADGIVVENKGVAERHNDWRRAGKKIV